ncbi:MAG: prenyltransferase [Anaerolineae bacterium]|jgi:1,4-dihydroxy-2-naphthoate octaprenyltransferase
MTARARLVSFVILGRPHFLAGALVLYASGAAGAYYLGYPLNVSTFAWGLACVLATQLMTHYSNDYYDSAADALNRTPTLWSGGSRVLVRGDLPPEVAQRAALAFGLAAAALGLYLTFGLGTGPLVLPLVGISMALAWAYSAPPLRLHSRGLGELDAGFVVGVLTPLIGHYLQTGRVSPSALLAAIHLLPVGFTMILAVQFPDAIGDALADKRSLVVRLGGARAALVHNGALAAAYLSLVPLTALGLPPAIALVTALTLPLAVVQIRSLHRGAWLDPRRFPGLTLRAILIIGLTGTAHLVGYLLSA